MALSEVLVGMFSAWLVTMKSWFSERIRGAETGNELLRTASTVTVTVLASVIVTVAGPHASMLGNAVIGLSGPP